MVGAHLDSVDGGPGIQDNGSGSAAILEVAEQMAKVKTRQKVRFAWWGAEESGLIGSTFYVDDLTQQEQEAITLYLNSDAAAASVLTYTMNTEMIDEDKGKGKGNFKARHQEFQPSF